MTKAKAETNGKLVTVPDDLPHQLDQELEEMQRLFELLTQVLETKANKTDLTLVLPNHQSRLEKFKLLADNLSQMLETEAKSNPESYAYVTATIL